jgi:hypothetical protein
MAVDVRWLCCGACGKVVRHRMTYESLRFGDGHVEDVPLLYVPDPHRCEAPMTLDRFLELARAAGCDTTRLDHAFVLGLMYQDAVQRGSAWLDDEAACGEAFAHVKASLPEVCEVTDAAVLQSWVQR